VVDVAGNIVDDIRYHAFVATRSGGTNTPTDKRFTGQTLDASTGLYDFGARSYDCLLGRFCQPDSIVPNPGNPQSLNRFSYCRNNPLKFVDPTGHAEEDPYYFFVGGYGTTNESNSNDWSSMIQNLGLADKPGSYGFFNWESGWSGSGKPSENRPVADAAPELAAQIGGTGT